MAGNRKTFISPPGVPILAGVSTIEFPPLENWLEVPMDTARITTGDPASPWNPKMAEAIDGWKNGRTVDLAGEKSVRIGIAAALIATMPNGKKAPIFSQFDATHPRRPLELSPPAGLLRMRDLVKNALVELGEEIILSVPFDQVPDMMRVGLWTYNGEMLARQWVGKYAADHRLILDETCQIPVTITAEYPKLTTLRFGLKTIEAWVAFEPDTGAVEVMIPMTTACLPTGTILEDGETLPNGDYRHSRVVPLLLTDKARVITEAFVKAK